VGEQVRETDFNQAQQRSPPAIYWGARAC